MAIKNGSREGTTEFAHRESPSFAAVILLLEKKTRHMVNKQNKKGKKCFLKFKKKNKLFFTLKSPNLLYEEEIFHMNMEIFLKVQSNYAQSVKKL